MLQYTSVLPNPHSARPSLYLVATCHNEHLAVQAICIVTNIMFKSLRKFEQDMSAPPSSNQLPEIVLFGDSLTEWSFDDSTQGFGLHLEKLYAGQARVVDEGGYASFPTFSG